MSTTQSLLDRRAFGRRRACIHATILIAGRPPSPCVMRNFSKGGALLNLSERLEPPYNFKLRFDLTGERIECELKHVRNRWMGVQFAGADVEDKLRRALGERLVQRKRPLAARYDVALTRVTGRELRKTVLGQE
jgi:hypothetical protein